MDTITQAQIIGDLLMELGEEEISPSLFSASAMAEITSPKDNQWSNATFAEVMMVFVQTIVLCTNAHAPSTVIKLMATMVGRDIFIYSVTGDITTFKALAANQHRSHPYFTPQQWN